MKYLLVLGVVMFAIWLWRHNRETQVRDRAATRPRRPPPPAEAAAVPDMVPCAQCGLHLPQSDAVTGQRGQYCSDAHRRLREG